MTSSRQDWDLNQQRKNIRAHIETLKSQKYVNGIPDPGNLNSVFCYDNKRYNIADLYAAVIILIKIVKYLYEYLEDQIEKIRKDIVECIIKYFKDKGISNSTGLSSAMSTF